MLWIPAVDRGIDEFNGSQEPVYASPQGSVVIGKEIGIINPGKWLVMRVFKQWRRPYREGEFRHCQIGFDIFLQIHWHTGTGESCNDLLITLVTQGKFGKIVTLHELVKRTGANHCSARHRNFDIWKCVENGIAVDQVVYKGQTPPFTTKRTFTNT